MHYTSAFQVGSVQYEDERHLFNCNILHMSIERQRVLFISLSRKFQNCIDNDILYKMQSHFGFHQIIFTGAFWLSQLRKTHVSNVPTMRWDECVCGTTSGESHSFAD